MKLELLVPNNINEIPLGSYQRFMEVTKTNEDSSFIADKMIQIFCGIELKEVVKIKSTDIFDLVKHFNEMFSIEPKLQHRFKIHDKEFGFIPDMENMTFGEYVDLETNIGDLSNLHKAMAVMFRPITESKGEKYLIEPYNGTATYSDVMKFAPLGVSLGARLFFWNLNKELLQASIRSLEEQVGRVMSLASDFNLTKNGDGTIQSINLLKATLDDLMKLQGWECSNVLPYSVTKLTKADLN